MKCIVFRRFLRHVEISRFNSTNPGLKTGVYLITLSSRQACGYWSSYWLLLCARFI